MIKRNEYQGEIALGKRIKVTAVSTLDSVVELAGTVADTITTVRTGIELLHGAIQLPIMEQRIELAHLVNNGVKELVEAGMTEKQACEYLQVPFVPLVPKTSKLANVVTA